MMRMRTLPLLLSMMLGSSGLAADRPLREAESENDRFRLRVEPGRPGRVGEPCRGELSERVGRRDESRWKRPLVNTIAPLAAAIRDDGKFVVCLDEYRFGGARNALVIYGHDGTLLRHFLLPDLLEKDNWKGVKVDRRSIDWRRGATMSFPDGTDEFHVRLREGAVIRIDLLRLRVLGKGDGGDLPPAVARALYGDDAGTSTNAAGDGGQPDDPGAQNARLEETGDPPVPADLVPLHGELQPDGNDPVAITGIDVPLPDPSNPVDYLAWLNEQALTDGPNAGDEFQKAIDSLVEWDGDPEQWDRALDGDPGALADPAIQTWLQQNRTALQHFRNGTLFEYKGWQLESEDGSMIGALLPNLSPMRQLTRTAIIEGRTLESEGRVDDAIDLYLDTLVAGAQTGRGPTLIENLVGVAMQGATAETLMDLPTRHDADTIDYIDLAARLEYAYERPRPMSETVQFERAMFMDSVQRVYDYDESSGTYHSNEQEFNRLVNMTGSDDDPAPIPLKHEEYDELVAQANRMYDRMVVASSRPFPESKAAFAAIDRDLVTQSGGYMLKTFLPALGRADFMGKRADTTRQASLLLTNIMAYKQQHGQLPDSLDAFGDRPFVVDPLTNERFVYQRVDDDFLLYSLGQNGTDEGGEHGRNAVGDLRFWPRPPKN